jgi:hypothetical protein
METGLRSTQYDFQETGNVCPPLIIGGSPSQQMIYLHGGKNAQQGRGSGPTPTETLQAEIAH